MHVSSRAVTQGSVPIWDLVIVTGSSMLTRYEILEI